MIVFVKIGQGIRYIWMIINLFWNILRVIRVLLLRKNLEDWYQKEVPIWAYYFLSIYGGVPSIKGKEFLKDIDWNRNVFFISNHQSYLDIPALIAAVGRKIGFTAKIKLKRIPLMSFWMRQLGCILISNKYTFSFSKEFIDEKAKTNQKHIVLFPTGTRSKNGELGKFKKGGLKIIWDIKPIIVPVIVTGSRSAVENRKAIFGKFPISVEFLAPVDLQNCNPYLNFRDWITNLESSMSKKLNSVSPGI